ncbi:hypothetical protein BGX26_010583 [Mortierella sp. AD094]|nr:hypothetical protein BGX26_010583 [Mortierella sp. AD094]
MAKVFSLTPYLPEPHRRENKEENLSSLSPLDAPEDSFCNLPSSTFSNPTSELTKTLFKNATPSSSDYSKVILSFFLSPTGYRLLRRDYTLKRKNRESVSQKHKGSDNAATKKAQVTGKGRSKKRPSSLIDPEEYSQWFNHPDDISSATRAGIRGFTLAFIAGTIVDVILPAMLKRNFKGLLRKILTNYSALSLGLSTGSFALVYKLVFRHSAVFLHNTLMSSSRARRSDSGIDLEIERDIKGMLNQQQPQQVDAREENEQMIDIPNGSRRRKWISAIIASMAAMPAFAIIPQQTRRLTFALYFLTYAGEVAYASLEHTGYKSWMPSWFGSAWIKVIMSQSSPYLHRPPQFDRSVLGSYPFIEEVFTGINGALRGGPQSIPVTAANLGSTAASAGTYLVSESCLKALQATEGMGYDSVACRLFHPTTSKCSGAMMGLLRRNSMFAFKMYTTLSVLTFLARGGRVFQNGVLSYFSKTGFQILRSVLFTTCTMMTAFPMLCGMDRVLPTGFFPAQRHYLNGFLSGFFILLDTPKRQSALTLYYVRFMLEIIWRRLVKAGYIRNIK